MKTYRTVLKTLIAALIALSAVFGVSIFVLSGNKTVLAQSDLSVTSFLPNNAIEYQELNSPTNAVYNNGKAAVILLDGSILIYNNGEYVDFKNKLAIGNPHQVKFLSETTLLISDNANLYTLDLKNPDENAKQFKFGEELVSGRSFDLNENFLITISGNTIIVYGIKNSTITDKKIPFDKARDNTPVCVNDDNAIFYVSTDGKLKKHLISHNADDSNDIVLLDGVTPTFKMVANDRYVYYTDGNTIKRVATDGSSDSPELLSVANDGKSGGKYDIGRIVNPTDISFKGDNLLICDEANDTVTEFVINDGNSTLSYSGFAIAKGKTAYNRVGESDKKIDRTNDRTAVLDSFKFTLISDGDPQTFTNFIRSDVQEIENAKEFALGENNALFYDDVNATLTLLGFRNSTFSTVNAPANYVMRDVKYFNDFYYLLATKDAGLAVFKFNPSDLSISEVFSSTVATANPCFDVKFDGSFVVANVIDDGKAVYLFSPENDFEGEKIYSLTEEAKDISIDLAEQIFVLCDNQTILLDTTNKAYLLKNKNTAKSGAVSFSLSPYERRVFVLFSDDERIYSADTLPVFTVEDLSTEKYVITDYTTTFDKLEAYSIKEEYSVCSINAVTSENITTFEFDRTVNHYGNDYALICKTSKQLISGKTIEFLILAGETTAGGTVTIVVDSRYASRKNITLDQLDYDKAYCSTSVGMYYLPIISLDGSFCLSKNEKIRLAKNDCITVEGIINFLGRDYYFATATKMINDETLTVSGYVPVNFTVKQLSDDIVGEKYEIRKIEASNVYDEDGNVIFTLTEDQTVRVFDVVLSDKTLISFNDGNGWIKGYVLSTAIKTPVNNSLRNALIIILASASVLATSAYLIIRKK